MESSHEYAYKKMHKKKKKISAVSVFSYLQNVSPPLLVENIILEVFSVDLLRLLDLLWGHYFSWRGRKDEAQEGSGRYVGETHTDTEQALTGMLLYCPL